MLWEKSGIFLDFILQSRDNGVDFNPMDMVSDWKYGEITKQKLGTALFRAAICPQAAEIKAA